MLGIKNPQSENDNKTVALQSYSNFLYRQTKKYIFDMEK